MNLTLGGTTDALGYNQSCNHLRCLSCDFKCISFSDAIWSEKSEYLVFRNFVPDKKKLQEYIIPKKGIFRIKLNFLNLQGYVAYCCQCSWIAINKITPVLSTKLKWVCSGHEF